MVEQSVEFADRLKIVTAIKAAGLIKMRCYRASGLIYMNLNYWIQKIEYEFATNLIRKMTPLKLFGTKNEPLFIKFTKSQILRNL